MLRTVIGALFLCLLALPQGLYARPAAQYQGEITSPRPNAVLRGVVGINGTANHPDFWKYEVRVAPGQNPGAPDDQWVRLSVQEQAISGGQLAVWDTTRVADGVYTLRLRVVRRDGNWQDYDILPLNVTNSAPPTSTPLPPTPIPTETPAETPTEIAEETPEESATPELLPTLPAAPGVDPTALPTAVAVEGESLSPTPITVDQPVVAAQPSVDEEPTASPDDEAPAPRATTVGNGESVGDLLGDGFGLGGLASSFISGAMIAAGLFLVVGVLYLLKVLYRVFQ